MGSANQPMGSARKLQIPYKKKTQSSLINNLTDELLIEILLRVFTSSKEAILFKLVCKRWFSLISSHYFATSFINNNDKSLLPFTIVLHDTHNVEHVEFFPEHRNSVTNFLDLRFLLRGRINDHSISLEGSCGDLILCSDKTDFASNYFICNIITRQYIALPPAPSGKGKFGEMIGFLYEPLHDVAPYKYTVLRFIPCGWYHHEGNSMFHVEIFSSDKGEWTKFVVASPRVLNSSSRKTSVIACGQMLYTLNYKEKMMVNCVVAFDPFNDDPAQFVRVIDLPDEARDIVGVGVSALGMCRGRLRFAQVIFQPVGINESMECRSISIWELEDYRMGQWKLVYKRITTSTVLRVHMRDGDNMDLVSILAFHPNNEDLLCFRLANYRLIVYNVRTDEEEGSACSPLVKWDDVESHVLPINSTWWPTPVR